MVEIAQGLTRHTIVLIVDKRERGITYEITLKKLGCRVIMAFTLYDALKYVAQEMPHLIITEAMLSDGTAGGLYDRLAQHPTFGRTPILVNVLKKNRESLEAIAGRQFAGFFLGKANPQQFATKVLEVLKSHSNVSPYFIDPGNSNLEPKMALSLNAIALGRGQSQLICASSGKLDSKAVVVCVTKESPGAPALLKMANNEIVGENIYNLFPINRISGKGRQWVESLPEFDIFGSNEATQSRRVLFYDPNEQRFEQFKQILSGYDVELTHADSLRRVTSLVKSAPDSYDCVYLSELTNDTAGIEWKTAYSELEASVKPPLLIGTSSQSVKNTEKVLYIKKPFGLGVLIDSIESAFALSNSVCKKAPDPETSGLKIAYKSPAQLIGLDEAGGIVELGFPIDKGAKVELDHKVLTEIWGTSEAQVEACSQVETKKNTWQVRFSAMAAAGSKTKYWEKLQKFLDSFRENQQEKSA